MMRVLIADDHPMFRDGLRAVLAGMDGIEVVGEASDGDATVAEAEATRPDVIVMDIAMPGRNGIEATRAIVAADPACAVLILTMFDDDDSVFAAMRAGARGYVLKGAGQDEIVRAISAVAAGELIFSADIARRVLGFFRGLDGDRRVTPFPELTVREREILDLIAAGRSNREIAHAFMLSEKTVRNHISNIFSKLQVADRAQAIVRARESGLGDTR